MVRDSSGPLAPSALPRVGATVLVQTSATSPSCSGGRKLPEVPQPELPPDCLGGRGFARSQLCFRGESDAKAATLPAVGPGRLRLSVLCGGFSALLGLGCHRRYEQEEEAVLGHARTARLCARAGPRVRLGEGQRRPAGLPAGGAGKRGWSAGRPGCSSLWLLLLPPAALWSSLVPTAGRGRTGQDKDGNS